MRLPGSPPSAVLSCSPRDRAAAAPIRRSAGARARSLQPGSVRRGDQRGRAGAAAAGARRRADLIAARAYLERFRDSAAPTISTTRAIVCAASIRSASSPRERAEYIVGLGETLFFDGAYGAAATLRSDRSRARRAAAGDARERVLDWWATALDRDARPRAEIERQPMYQRIRDADAATSSATNPVSAVGRVLAGGGRARARAICRRRGMRRSPAWVRAPLAADRGARSAPISIGSCCARIVARARTGDCADARSAAAEWEQFKERWKK